MSDSLQGLDYDLVVVGAGIVGLATAYAARCQGLSVAVVERQAHSVGASVRNFGFVTVTGQRAGAHWRRALRAREVWGEVAPRAGIPVLQQGLCVLAQRPEAMDVLEAFALTEMGQACELLTASQTAQRYPFLGQGVGALYSPHECRVESREAIPRLARWLQQEMGVVFHWSTAVQDIALPAIDTSRGRLRAERCIVCPGHDLNSLYPAEIARAQARLCTLQMLRVRPAQALHLPAPVMSDLSLVRYEGYSALPQAQALLARLQQEQAEHLRQGVHLIAVQSADGSLVVGDSHVYDGAEAPFAHEAIDALILQELQRVLPLPGLQVVERWTGTYASAEDVVFQASPAPGVVLGIVTGGTGASTAFAFAEELLAQALA
ncbi:TIGR03364 family FAD-dependent oxidoreductase [Kerstersia similis]|uniref:TIGR03364 family FAD-dependent oxidoreductase n=1 Tax=Kerstersia similis TaxID=206505 RepID=UPI0039F13029